PRRCRDRLGRRGGAASAPEKIGQVRQDGGRVMRLGRLLLVLVVIALGWWLWTRSGLFGSRTEAGEAGGEAPVSRARPAAAASSGRAAETGAAQREADAPASFGGGSVSENMTPDQVRSLLGSPDETSSETTDTGAPREKWIYRSVGKTVVFENGVV